MTQSQTSVTPLDARTRHRELLHSFVSKVRETTDVVTLPLSQAWGLARSFVLAHLGTRAESLLVPATVWVFVLLWAGQGVRDSLGWWGYGVVIVLTAPAFVVLFAAAGRRVTLRRLPVGVSAFALVTCLSIVWSQYKVMTFGAGLAMILTTGAGVMVAIAFPLRQMVDHLLRALQWIIGLSFALELFVAVVVRHPLPPLYMLHTSNIPPTAYWVNGLLLTGGPIQGIVGNRNPLGFIALMCGLCVVATWLDHRMSNARAALWMGLSLLTLGLTRSATVMMATIACAAVVVAAVLIRRLAPQQRRRGVHVAIALAVLLILAALAMHDTVSSLLGRDSDLTGRAEIWQRVVRLWELRPVTGWGWIMYWAPWIPMFRYLVVRPDGAPTMSAHNSYLETLFQTGLIGAGVLVVVVVWLLRDTYRVALHSLDTDMTALLPALAMTAMVIQSFTESRLISEGNWMLVAAIATWLTVRARPSREGDDERPSAEEPVSDFDRPLVGASH